MIFLIQSIYIIAPLTLFESPSSYFTLSFLLFIVYFFFFNDTATTEIYTFPTRRSSDLRLRDAALSRRSRAAARAQRILGRGPGWRRSEEHTSELQSQSNLVCRLLLE